MFEVPPEELLNAHTPPRRRMDVCPHSHTNTGFLPAANFCLLTTSCEKKLKWKLGRTLYAWKQSSARRTDCTDLFTDDPQVCVLALLLIFCSALQCLVTCGKGYKHRQTWCQFGEDRLDDRLCGSAKPESVQACQQQECASWQVGPWGQVSVRVIVHLRLGGPSQAEQDVVEML